MRGINHMLVQALAGQGATRVANKLSTGNTLAVAANVVPGVVPTAPGPGDVFKEGGQCTFTWTPDPSGTWKQTDVELMSGDNFNMKFITTVATFDGTDTSKTSFSYACPDVEPNSAIYFYQFSTPAAPKNLTWTTRFTIAAADGSTTPPANDTQPDGQKISWGVGALADPSKATALPSYLGGGAATTTSSSASTSSTSSSSTSSSTSTSSAPTTSSSSTAATVSTTNSAGQASTVTVSTTSSSASATTSGTSSGGSGNGAVGASARASFGAAALAMGATAVVFALMS